MEDVDAFLSKRTCHAEYHGFNISREKKMDVQNFDEQMRAE